RAADRWRSLDSDGVAACQVAGHIFQTIGADDLAWDYLTTPLRQRRDEPAPWRNLARTLRDEGQLELAARAYRLAFETEPTDATRPGEQPRGRAENGKRARPHDVLLRIADGEWPTQFLEWQAQAQRQAEMKKERPAAGK